jgi:protein-S-isoprenylcysteine O-methyltransferase Ste14
MVWFCESFFPAVWITFLIYWRIKAANTKNTHRLEPAVSGILRILAILVAIILLSTTWIPLPWLYRSVWRAGFWPFWMGAAITVSGLLFAVWAREHLGRNWSSQVSIKQDHELITTGPYAVVRHPIYTGILAGFLGVAIALCAGSSFSSSSSSCSGSSSARRSSGCALSLERRMPSMSIGPPPSCLTSSDASALIQPHATFRGSPVSGSGNLVAPTRQIMACGGSVTTLDETTCNLVAE